MYHYIILYLEINFKYGTIKIKGDDTVFLSKNCKYLLNLIIQSVNEDSMMLSTDFIPLQNLPDNDLHSALVYLDKIEYIKMIWYTDGGFRIILLEKGKHHNQAVIYEIKSFIIKSILVPIFVSFFTSLALNIALK